MGWLAGHEARAGVIEHDGSGAILRFGGRRTATGRHVDADTARKYSAYWRAVSYSAGHIATLPLKLYRSLDDGGKVEQRDHPSYGMVKETANPEMGATAFREAEHGHVLTRGNAYAEIVRNGRGQAMELWPLNPDKTTLKRDRDGNPYYEVKVDGQARRLPFDSVLHVPGLGFDGRKGYSVLGMARESIGLGLASEEYSARFFGNNATPSGILTSPTEMSPEAKQRLKTQWEAAHGGLDKQHRVAVLEGDLTWQSLGISAEDAQLLESRTFQIRDMARWFGLPPHKLMELSDATFSNIESQSLEVLIDHLRPWARRWENALNNQLLTERERNRRGLFFKFNLDGLLRADAQARAEKQRTEFNIGMATINELRALEERNPLDNEFADMPFIRGEMMPLDQAGQMAPTERMMMKALSEGHSETVGRLAEVRLAELNRGGAEDREREDREARERRSVQRRRELVNTFEPLFVRDFERLVRIETQDLRSNLGILSEQGPDAFFAFLDEFYGDEIAGKIERSGLAELMRRYAEPVTREAADTVEDDPLSALELDQFVGNVTDEGSYVGTFVNRYAASSRIALVNVVEDALAESESRDHRQEHTPRDAVEERLDQWQEGTEDARPRADQQAEWEVNRLGNAVAKATFVAAGIGALVWRELGESCPLCNAMDGRIVASGSLFIDEGDELEGDDGETTITPRYGVGHPPLHSGCDCLVMPG